MGRRKMKYLILTILTFNSSYARLRFVSKTLFRVGSCIRLKNEILERWEEKTPVREIIETGNESALTFDRDKYCLGRTMENAGLCKHAISFITLNNEYMKVICPNK